MRIANRLIIFLVIISVLAKPSLRSRLAKLLLTINRAPNIIHAKMEHLSCPVVEEPGGVLAWQLHFVGGPQSSTEL